jgi:hypothetical protein
MPAPIYFPINNAIQIKRDGTFSFTPHFDTSPLSGLEGCDPTFVGTFENVSVDALSSEWAISSLNATTGAMVGTVDLLSIPIDGVCPWALQVVTCEGGTSIVQVLIPYEVMAMKAVFSLNPISAKYYATDYLQNTELEIFAETESYSEVFKSLGTFSINSNDSILISERIDHVLNAWLLRSIAESLPIETALDSYIETQLSARFYFRYRTFGLTWSEWAESEPNMVVYGGEPYEEFNGEGISNVFMQPQEIAFKSYGLDHFFYFLFDAASISNSMLYTIYDLQGTTVENIYITQTTTQPFQIVRFKVPSIVGFLPEMKIRFFSEIALTAPISVFQNPTPNPATSDFVFLNSKGGWSFLPCEGYADKQLEFERSGFETSVYADYFSNSNFSQYSSFKINGRKKQVMRSGFYPQKMLSIVAQDFMLSPFKFLWNSELSKFLPIIVSNKSLEYQSDFRTNVRSFSFEFQFAFDSNLPSKI